MDVELDKEYQGQKCKVVHCKGAIQSFDAALQLLPGKKKRESMKRGMILLINRLANGHRMSKADFPPEGPLPKRPGQDNGKFYAFKRIPIRAYVWLSKRLPGTYFISHYVCKRYDDLKQADIDLVGENWARIEEDGDER